MQEFDLSGPADRQDVVPRARAALVADGCLVLRNALPVARIRRLRHELAGAYSRLSGQQWGWQDLRRHARGEDLLGMRRALFGCPSNGALFRHERLTGFLGDLLGGQLYLHPRRWLRLNEPGTGHGTWTVPHHQDYRFVHGSPDVLTVWVPLHPCQVGGIVVERRSHRGGLRPLGDRVPGNHLPPVRDVSAANLVEPRCAAGDVVVFHSLTVHGTAPNPGRLNRISVDARFQRADDPIAAEQLVPAVAPQDNLPIGAPGVLDEDPVEWSGDPFAAAPEAMPLVPSGAFTVTEPLVPPRFAPVG